MSNLVLGDTSVPAWLPTVMCNYLDHAREGTPLRAIARREGISASTVLRQVRRIESRREDPLLDAALEALVKSRKSSVKQKDILAMTAPLRTTTLMTDAETLAREARRVLRRLAEPGAFLAIAQGLEKAAVLREYSDGSSHRTAVLDQTVAQAFALKDWIACRSSGRVARYEITVAGRAALRRFLAEDEVGGMAEAPQVFAGQHRIWAEKAVAGENGEPARRLRYNLAESPVAALGRRRDKDGVPFLTPEQIGAGERLREDFEVARWDRAWPKIGTVFSQAAHEGISRPTWGQPKARAMPASGWRLPCARLGPDLAIWRCAAAATSKGWKPPRNAWAGRRVRARWCCASRLIVWWPIIPSSTVSRVRQSARGADRP